MAEFDENKGRDLESSLGFCVYTLVLGHGLVLGALGLLGRKRSWRYVENIPLSQAVVQARAEPGT